jgi:hypothetical protein
LAIVTVAKVHHDPQENIGKKDLLTVVYQLLNATKLLLNWPSRGQKDPRQIVIVIKCRLDRRLAGVPRQYTWLAEIAAPIGRRDG